jgi:pSer/pThr/pTyr-binding forkhead associated (FHA) protein
MNAARPQVQVALSLNGRPLRHYAFSQSSILIGREPSADVFLDNPGVSRNHARLQITEEGWQLLDLGSANGTYLEGERVDRAILKEESQVQVGKFTLRIVAQSAAAEPGSIAARTPVDMLERTTVLTRGQLAVVMSAAREPSDPELRASAAEAPQASVIELAGATGERARAGFFGSAVFWGLCIVLALLAGFFLGRQ